MAAVKAGFLQKLSGFLKRDWKKKYFVLYQDGRLVYCERPGEEHTDGQQVNIKHGCHRIDYAQEVEIDAQRKTAGRVACLFSINTTQKTIFLLADSEQDARDWVQKLKVVHQSSMAMGSYATPVQQMGQPGMAYPGNPPGIGYPNSQPGMPYLNSQQSLPYQNNQPTMPYPNSQPGMQYPTNMQPPPYVGNQPPMYSNNPPGMAMPYTTAASYPTQYNQQMTTGAYQGQPYVTYQNTPQYYQTQPGGYPVYQQQQVQQTRSGGLSSRRGLLTGAAGGALVGGVLGYGMGRSVGGFGGSFDSCGSDFDCDFGGCD